MSQEMAVKENLKCVLNMPEKLSSEYDGDGEGYHGLPPYAPIDTYPVDEYEACPINWMHGSDMASSYFLGVKEDHGMWLDFNECFYHTHDVAVVISIQGINPITGQKMVANKALRLEQYHKKCPVHGVKFQQDRFCKECGFKWPGQNYLATTGTPEMMMWLDGFRTPDGKVRQYIFTEDKMKGVASQLIGEERVFAIGIAYYLSKHKKPYTLKRPEERTQSSGYNSPPAYMGPGYHHTQPMFFSPMHTPQSWNNRPILYGGNNPDMSGDVDVDMGLDSLEADSTEMGHAVGGDAVGGDMGSIISASAANMKLGSIGSNLSNKKGKIKTNRTVLRASAAKDLGVKSQHSVKPVVPVKKLEIGAGALIKQSVFDDPKMMSYWEEEPAGMIYINYCDEETKKKIIDAGRRADEKDGFMQGIKVGG